MFPEPFEFCLGHGKHSVRGRGAGKGLRPAMLEGCVSAIRAGISKVEHFEELMIFRPGIGVDRISDITCNVLKSRFIDYTLRVAERHDVPLESVGVRHSDWKASPPRWFDRKLELPRNPFGKQGVLLCPERFLTEIPVIEPSDFWDWSWTNHGEELRNDLNYDIATNVDSKKIIRLARKRPDLIRTYVNHKESAGAKPYDFGSDPLLTKSYDRALEIAQQFPLRKAPSNPGAFCDFVQELISKFQHAVEETNSWKLLWHDATRARSEAIVQSLFRSIVVAHCEHLDIDLSPESNAGRGPVDFKFSKGWEARALAEVKLVNNSRYWHGLKVQTPQYMKTEKVKCGYFVSICFRDKDFSKARRDVLASAIKAVNKREGITLKPIYIDARPKVSASKKKA